MNKPYIVIARKSTDKQENSLDTQLTRIQAWATSRNIQLLVDDRFIITESGKRTRKEHRPYIADALAMIRAGLAAGIIVTKLDRLSRSLSELIEISHDIATAGGDLVVLDQNIDTSNPAGRLFFHMVGAFAEFEREMIVERTKETKEKLRREGRHVSGRVPYGYTVTTDNFLSPILTEQAILSKIQSWRKSGLSYDFITWKLNEENIPAKNGGKWHRNQVVRLANRGKQNVV